MALELERIRMWIKTCFIHFINVGKWGTPKYNFCLYEYSSKYSILWNPLNWWIILEWLPLAEPVWKQLIWLHFWILISHVKHFEEIFSARPLLSPLGRDSCSIANYCDFLLFCSSKGDSFCKYRKLEISANIFFKRSGIV